MVNTKVDPVEIKNELVVSYSLSESALLGIHRGGSASPAGPAMAGPLFFNNGCGS